MKIIWELPHATHTRFLESLSPVPHLESVLTGRYLGFVGHLVTAKNPVLGLIFRTCKYNISSQTGHNIRYLLDKHNKVAIVDLVAEKITLKKSRVYSLPDEETWKISIIKELALVKRGILQLDFDDNNLEAILEQICAD